MSFTEAEKCVLTSLGGFLLNIEPTAKLFLLDSDWPRIDGPYFGIQSLTVDKTGYSDLAGFNGDDEQIHHVGYILELEIIAFRGTTAMKPNGMLQKVQHLFRDQELMWEYFTKNNVGLLDTSGITRIDTVLDGTEKELRSRMTIQCHITIEEFSTIPSVGVETINYTIEVDGNSTNGSGSVTYP